MAFADNDVFKSMDALHRNDSSRSLGIYYVSSVQDPWFSVTTSKTYAASNSILNWFFLADRPAGVLGYVQEKLYKDSSCALQP